MMEPVELGEPVTELPEKPWAVDGTARTRKNLISSIVLEPEELEAHNRRLQRKYESIANAEVRCETMHTEDADVILVGYGIVSRVLQSVVEVARSEGLRVGLLRPITLWPFPTRLVRELADTARLFFVSELSNGQMIDDVRLALAGKRPVRFYGRMGGVVPTTEEILGQLKEVMP
jgi:pyruvate/2-oxoacid:ferredoxin oxidoreductase alpha subunit